MVGPQRLLLDTSTLVAALYQGHPQHVWARAQFVRAQKGQGLISAHTLAELYKVLTGHPHIRMLPADAVAILSSLTGLFDCIPLDEADYHAALTRCAAHNLSGGVMFDALIAQAALKAEAQALITLNPKDFRRLGDDVQALVVSP